MRLELTRLCEFGGRKKNLAVMHRSQFCKNMPRGARFADFA
jgi:hypothetical protein